MRFLDAAKNCAVAIALSLRTPAVVATGSLLMMPVIAGCGEIDIETTEGLKRGLKENKKMGDIIKKISDFTPEQLDEIGAEMMERYLDGTVEKEHSKVLADKLLSLNNPKYKDAYIKALKSGEKELVNKAASVIAELKIEGADAAFDEAFNKTNEVGLRQTLLKQGAVLKSKKMAKRAAKILSGTLSGQPIQTVRVSCEVLASMPNKEIADKLLYATFFRDSGSPQTSLDDCRPALTALGHDAFAPIQKALTVDDSKSQRSANVALNALLEKPGLRHFSYEYVLRELGAQLLISGHPQASAPLIKVFDRADPVRAPYDLIKLMEGDDNATFNQLSTKWTGLAMATYQNTILGISRMGVEGLEAEFTRAMLKLAKWSGEQAKKWEVFTTTNSLFESAYRVLALRVLADQGRLFVPFAAPDPRIDPAVTPNPTVWDHILAELNDPLYFTEWTDPKKEHMMFLPITLFTILGDAVIQLSIYSQADWMEKVYGPLEATLMKVEQHERLKKPEEAVPPRPEGPLADDADEATKNQHAAVLAFYAKLGELCTSIYPEMKGNQALIDQCVDRVKYFDNDGLLATLKQFKRAQALFVKARTCTNDECWTKELEAAKKINDERLICTSGLPRGASEEVKVAHAANKKRWEDGDKNKPGGCNKMLADMYKEQWEELDDETKKTVKEPKKPDPEEVISCVVAACDNEWREKYYMNAPDLMYSKALYELSKNKANAKKIIKLYQGGFDADGYHLDALFRVATVADIPAIDEVIKAPQGRDENHSKLITKTLEALKLHLENSAAGAAPSK